MDVHKGNIFSILDGNKQFIIPLYQRLYSWDKIQCEQLWTDIVNMQKKHKQGHFVGSIVNIAEKAMPTGVQKYMIIDGQQRLTTLTLLLIALRDYAQNHPEDETINAVKIENVHLKNQYEKKDERYKLLLTQTDKDNLIALIEKRSGIDTETKIYKNYCFFQEKIEQNDIKPLEIYEAVGKLQIVNITLERTVDDAQAIFESLNSTGKELSQSDLIRNYVLMGLDTEKQTELYENIWRPMELLFGKQTDKLDGFFRNYLTLKLARVPRENDIYDEFKLYRLKDANLSIEKLCQDLLDYAEIYTDILFEKSVNITRKKLYQDINTLQISVAYPFLMKVCMDCKNEIISENELIEIISLCCSYVFRRNICGIPTNSLNKTFATLRTHINEDDYLNSIKAFMILRNDYRLFPDDELFTEAFVKKDIYNMRTRNYLLNHLENFENKTSVVIENLTIEHIMPQNTDLCEEWKKDLGSNWKDVQKQYLHTIGNLTLTAYNSEMSDKPFAEKMEMDGGFKQSALRLNSYVIKQCTWNEEKIKERARELAQKAVKIWKYPSLSAEDLSLYSEQIDHDIQYDIASYEMNTATEALFTLLDKRILNLSSTVRRELKKKYVAYKVDTNFADIIFQKNGLRIYLNMPFNSVADPKNLCRDVTGIGKWGNGDVSINFNEDSKIDDVMALIEQSFNFQFN